MPSAEAVVLPDNVRPIHYDLTLTPKFDDFTFDGEVDVTVSMEPGTAEIMLNCSEIEIHSATVSWTDTNGEQEQAATGIAYDADAETATISIPGTPADGLVGNQHLRMTFTGELNDKLRGFYRSQYVNPEGETAYLATTQFEATDARRALPCWDEPAAKATFQVTLNVPEEMEAVSNTPIIEETRDGNGLKTLLFDTTPVMSTYLLAFVIGDLTHIEKEAADGTRIGVWMTRGKEEQGEFALDTSVKMLSFFNDYFGIPYPLPKLDHLAIPDFAAGAMENWGCITYRETALLVDPQNSSAGTRQRVAEVVAPRDGAHVVGDLVTWSGGMTCGSTKFRHVGGHQSGGLAVPGMVDVDAVRQHGHQPGVQLGRPEELAPNRAGSCQPGGGEPAVRRHQLQQGRVGAADAGAFPDAQRVPDRAERILDPTLLRERPHHGPVDGAGGNLGSAGELDHEQLDRSDRLPGAGRGGDKHRKRVVARGSAGAVRVRLGAG